MDEKIWLSPPHMGPNEQKYVQDVFETNWVAPVGPYIQRFEQQLATYNGIDHVAALSSGSAAIHLALIILGIQPGDEVICSTFTFAASANPICYLGARPVLVDSEPETWNIDPKLLKEAIEARIKAGNRPKAMVIVHLYGMPAKMDELMTIAREYAIPVVEDAAEALGSTYKGQKLGTFGDLGVYSFNGNKIITTSGGGALVSRNQQYIETARYLSTQARDPALHYQHSQIGYNYRMSNVCAAIGCGQMEVLDDRVKTRRENFEYYKEQLAADAYIEFLTEPEGNFSNRWLTCISLGAKVKKSPAEICRAFTEENIEIRPLWKPLHLQPVFEKELAYLNGVSERLFRTGICLPSGTALPREQQDRIIRRLKEVIGF